MSSLKQRAMQCSGYIPASQYVPVYSRSHRASQARCHEEIAPITPKPNLDDPYTGRTQSIHEAVKLWLDSSPNSVIGPIYRSRSPSSGSPPSNGESIEQQQPKQAAGVTSGHLGEATSLNTSRMESANDGFYDVGSGRVSPQQVSIEHSGVLAGGSSASSPRPPEQAENSTVCVGEKNQVENVDAAAPSPVKKSGGQSPEVALPKGGDVQKSNATDSVQNPADNEVPTLEEAPLAQTEEGKSNPTRKRRGGMKRAMSSDSERVYGLSFGSFSDFTSRAVSGEFDAALALVVSEIDSVKAFDTQSYISDYSSVVGAPNMCLKPPRGLEKSVASEPDRNSDVADVSALPRAASARLDRKSEVMKLQPPLPRSISAKEPQSSALTRVPQPAPPATSAKENQSTAIVRVPLFYRLGGCTDATEVAEGAHTSSNTEIVPVDDPEIVEDGDKENVSEAKQSKQRLPLVSASETKKSGFRASLSKIDEMVSRNKSPGTTPKRLTIKGVLQNEDKLSGVQRHETEVNSGDNSPVIISNGVALVAGNFEFRHERSSRRTRSNHSAGNSLCSTPNNVPEQHIYKVSPIHHIVSKVSRSKKQSARSPGQSQQQLRREKSNRSSDWEGSPRFEPVDEAKMEELRLKADVWENAKNAEILTRFKQEESKIYNWEESKVAKATVTLSKVQLDLETKKAKVAEKMQNEIAQARKKAAELRAHAEAKRAERAAKAAVQAQLLRVMGRTPLACFCS